MKIVFFSIRYSIQSIGFMQHILITGSSGFLGQYLMSALADQYMPLTVNRNSGNYKVDLSDENALKELLNQINVSAVIHLAANGNVNFCEQYPEETAQINVKATKILAEWANEKKIPFVFTSTDQVFDGLKGFYSEADSALPINEYGRQKLEAEKIVLKNKGIVCRMPLMIGEKDGYEKSFTENLLSGKTQHLFTDEWRSVLPAQIAAKALLKALQWSSGIYHLGGKKRINRYELGLQLAAKIPNANLSLIKCASQKDVEFIAPRPADVSLNSNKAIALGFEQE
jgi:dTDP-4-dehydrorhamnose reductase